MRERAGATPPFIGAVECRESLRMSRSDPRRALRRPWRTCVRRTSAPSGARLLRPDRLLGSRLSTRPSVRQTEWPRRALPEHPGLDARVRQARAADAPAHRRRKRLANWRRRARDSAPVCACPVSSSQLRKAVPARRTPALRWADVHLDTGRGRARDRPDGAGGPPYPPPARLRPARRARRQHHSWALRPARPLTDEAPHGMRAIDLGSHDLRHEAGSRWLEAACRCITQSRSLATRPSVRRTVPERRPDRLRDSMRRFGVARATAWQTSRGSSIGL
jgi:hypothetical protein